MPTYTMFNRDGKPSRAPAQMWLGLFENGNGKLFNLDNHTNQKSYLLNDRTVMGSNNRFVVCVFNCPNINMISGFSIEQSIRKSESSTPTYFMAAVTNEWLTSNGFFRTMYEVKADLSGITPSRLINLREAMNYIGQTIPVAASGGMNIHAWPQKWRLA